jgi:hypothetical protein
VLKNIIILRGCNIFHFGFQISTIDFSFNGLDLVISIIK